jgi:hypothetical protein
MVAAPRWRSIISSTPTTPTRSSRPWANCAASSAGQKATLLWDGLPAHRSKAMGAWLRRQRHWLVVEPLPGYAPELNPVEALWSNLKGVELVNLAGETLQEVIAAAEHGIQRIRDTHHLAYSFLRHCGLSLW